MKDEKKKQQNNEDLLKAQKTQNENIKNENETTKETIEQNTKNNNELHIKVLEKKLNEITMAKEKLMGENHALTMLNIKLKNTIDEQQSDLVLQHKKAENNQVSTIKKMAKPIIDAIGLLSNQQLPENLQEGVKMLVAKLDETLKLSEICKFTPTDEKVDINKHEIIGTMQGFSHKANKIAKVVEGGYMYKDEVIQHAKVIVYQA